jgi:hypothetical protein
LVGVTLWVRGGGGGVRCWRLPSGDVYCLVKIRGGLARYALKKQHLLHFTMKGSVFKSGVAFARHDFTRFSALLVTKTVF